MKKGYCIVKIGWEYNDEYYYRPESEGGKPVKVYEAQSVAEKECLRMNQAEEDEDITDSKDRLCKHYEVTEVELVD